MLIEYTITGTIEVPEGSILKEPRTIVLPDGNILKLWTAVELNEIEDITWSQKRKLGVDLTENTIDLEEVQLA